MLDGVGALMIRPFQDNRFASEIAELVARAVAVDACKIGGGCADAYGSRLGDR